MSVPTRSRRWRTSSHSAATGFSRRDMLSMSTMGERTLKELNIKAGGRIIILAGSGVRPGNIARLEASTGCKEFHSSSHGPDGRTSREVVAAMVNYNQ